MFICVHQLIQLNVLTLCRMGLIEAGGMGWGQKDPYLPKIFSTHPTMMKLGTIIPYKKKIQKIYKSPEVSNCCYIKKDRSRLHFNTYFLIFLTLSV